MKKEIIKSFDLEAYKKGAKVQTRGGHAVRIICTDAKDKDYPIVALMTNNNGIEVPLNYTYEGKFQVNDDTISKCDLVIVEEIEEPEFWSDKENEVIEGHYISLDSTISPFCTNINANNYGLFATEKQAKSARAMARISQITANDIEHFGGAITNKEWEDLTVEKYAICRLNNAISLMCSYLDYRFLAFHTKEQRDLFLKKYRDLVREYLMID